jgi:pilus assembly protein FimV
VLPTFALGLGEIRVRTSLGQSFLAHVDVIGADTEGLTAFCIKGQVLSIDGALLANTIISINESVSKKSITFISKAHINEPAVKLVVDVNCQTKLHREFSILLDPPVTIQGAKAPLQIDPPVFAVQTLPDLVSDPESAGQSASNTKKQTKNRKPTLDIVESGENQATPTKKQRSDTSEKSNRTQSNAAKSTKPAKPAKDVLKLSDDVLIYPPSQGLRMSDILSTQTGQELLTNIEELRAAQARMAAILRDEPIPSGATIASQNDIQPEANLNQLAELSQLRQEATQLKKQSQADKETIASLRSRNVNSPFSNWTLALIFAVFCLLAVCAYLFYYIRRNAGNSNATWWEQESNSNVMADEDKIEDIIDHVQSSYDLQEKQDKQNSVKNTPSKLEKSEEKQNSGKLEFTPDYFDPAPTTSNSPDGYTPTLEETNSSIFNFFSPRGSSVKVEEISDITQEAEFWISMNDPQRAIEILSPQEKIEHPDSPLPWLFLLDLYKTVKNVEKYNVLRERFIVFFNAQIPEFDTVVDAAEERHLDDFTHVMNHICSLWNDEKIIPYLESLLVDDREGKRMGFELPVYRDILMILGIAHELERIRVLEGQMNNTQATSKQARSSKFVDRSNVDPMADADIHIIEFDTIDFPTLPENKK